MDINEYRAGKNKHRHPWELSRSRCLTNEIRPYIQNLERQNGFLSFADIGPGDMYIDRVHLRSFPSHTLYAVDIGYAASKQYKSNVFLYRDIGEIGRDDLDYAFMMDSLEYMEDDVSYLDQITAKIKDGGYLFFTLPAFRFLFSDYDRIVGNLRRYDRPEFERMIQRNGRLRIIHRHYFYTPLFLIRLLQKFLHLRIDPDEERTTGWRFGKSHPVTRLLVGILNADYRLHRALAEKRILLPGLSLLVICQKTPSNRKDTFET